MKTCKYGILLFILFIIFTSCSQKSSLNWIPFIWQGDTISGKYIDKAYLYIPVTIDDLPYHFTMQLDLGTNETVFYGNPIDPYLEEYASLANKLDSVDLFNGMFSNINLKMGTIEFAGISTGYLKGFGEKPPKDSIYSNTPKHIGTIAPDIFQNKILVIDYKSCRLAVTDSLPAEYENLSAEKFEIENGIIKLPFRINGEESKLMFDTGSSPFPLVTSKERALEISDSIITDSLSGPLWWGTEITFYGLDVNKPIEFGGKLLKNSKVYYDKERLWENGVFKPFNIWGLTGNAYFFDNIVIIDYKNKLFRVQ